MGFWNDDFHCLDVSQHLKEIEMEHIIKYYVHELMNNKTLSNEIRIQYQEVINHYSYLYIFE